MHNLQHFNYKFCSVVHMVTYILLACPLNFLAHNCSFPGCGSVLVLDGNMKNHRDVCYAKDAGFIQFSGLPGVIKTGCPASPDFKSQYCSQHKSHACDLLNNGEVDDELGTTPGPALRSRRKRQHPGSPIAEMILAKKTTRKQTYYQVCALLTFQWLNFNSHDLHDVLL